MGGNYPDIKQVVLVGKATSLNQSITEIINEQDDMKAFQVESLDVLNERPQIPQIVILDLISTPGSVKSKVDRARKLSGKSLIITVHHYSEPSLIRAIKNQGADIYLGADMSEEELLSAVRKKDF